MVTAGLYYGLRPGLWLYYHVTYSSMWSVAIRQVLCRFLKSPRRYCISTALQIITRFSNIRLQCLHKPALVANMFFRDRQLTGNDSTTRPHAILKSLWSEKPHFATDTCSPQELVYILSIHRYRRYKVTVQPPSRRIVVSDSMVLENRPQLQIYINTQPQEKVSVTVPRAYVPLSLSLSLSLSPIPTQSHSPRTHHHPPPTYTCQDPPPTQHTRSESSYSDPDGFINVHPRFASKIPKSRSCHDAFNSMVIPMTTRLSGTDLSQQSSIASHTPIQVVSGASSPASKRGSIIRSIRSSLSGHSIASDQDANYVHVQYETPV